MTTHASISSEIHHDIFNQCKPSMLLFSSPAATAACTTATNLLFILFYSVGALAGVLKRILVVSLLSIHRRARYSLSPLLCLEITIRILGRVSVEGVLKGHRINNNGAGVIVCTQFGSGNDDITVWVV